MSACAMGVEKCAWIRVGVEKLACNPRSCMTDVGKVWLDGIEKVAGHSWGGKVEVIERKHGWRHKAKTLAGGEKGAWERRGEGTRRRACENTHAWQKGLSKEFHALGNNI